MFPLINPEPNPLPKTIMVRILLLRHEMTQKEIEKKPDPNETVEKGYV